MRRLLMCTTLVLFAALPSRAQLADTAVDEARALGERGRARDAILTCTSRKMRESFRHEGLPVVRMFISGAVGDIALAVADAKRANISIQLPDSLKDWHLNVLVQPATAAPIHAIFVQSASGAVAPSDMLLSVSSPDGQPNVMGTFRSAAARAAVEEGSFMIVAVMEAGERSCDVSPANRDRLGL